MFKIENLLFIAIMTFGTLIIVRDYQQAPPPITETYEHHQK